MRLNEHTAICTQTITLVPYSAQHVPTYHEWMKDPDLQLLTASDPLSLSEEYAMQQSWRRDGDKLTFIICEDLVNIGGDTVSTSSEDLHQPASPQRNGARDAESMIGDVNLFISRVESDDDDDRDKDDGKEKENEEALIGELELMIASVSARGKGYGRAVLVAFLQYVLTHEREILKEFHGVDGEGDVDATVVATKNARVMGDGGFEAETGHFDYFAVKIGETNVRSVRLFEGLGFRKTRDKPSYFGEFELRSARGEVEALVFADRNGEEEGYREIEYVCP